MASTDLSRSGLPRHGGDIGAATAAFGEPGHGWLDLSTGINPRPWPAPAVTMESLTRLPDPADLRDLLDAARASYDLAASAPILAVPGAEIAIRQIPHLLRCEKVAIVAPTYRSHGEAWLESGCEIAAVPELDLVPGDADVVVVANPNNPDGRICAVDPLAALADRLAARGGVLIVDEAFADLDPEISLMPYLDRVPAMVLRSFGKFFGLPGLRLGFVAGRDDLATGLADRLGDWPISGPTLDIARPALRDASWQSVTRIWLNQQAQALDDYLRNAGLEVAGGTDLFRFAAVTDSRALFEKLARAGVLIRIFDDMPDRARFGLPADQSALGRLAAALA